MVMKFDPNTNEHLIYTLKRAYKFASGDMEVGMYEMMNDLSDALCNLIGDNEFIAWLDNHNNTTVRGK